MAYYRDVEDDIVRGLISGSRAFGSYGKLTTGGAVNKQVIWPNGAWLVPPQTGIQPEILSNNAEDGAGTQTGILELHVHYIDTNYEEQTGTATLNGTTPVSVLDENGSVITDLVFVQCMHMTLYGSAKKAVGNITLREAGQTQAYSYISAGDNRCASSARMVPAGKRLIIRQALGSSTSGTSAATTNISIAATKFDEHDYLDDSVLIPFMNLGFQDSAFGIELQPPLVFGEKTVIAMFATSDKAATISGLWNGFIENIPTNGA